MSIRLNVRRALAASTCVLAFGIAAAPAFAQQAQTSTMETLVQSLMKKGVISQKDG